MTIDEIKALIAWDESRTLELKKTTGVMPHDMYDERIRTHEPKAYSWENMTGEGVTLADMDEGTIRNGIRRGINGGFITMTFKRPSYNSDPNENLETEVASKEDNNPLNYRLTTVQVPLKFNKVILSMSEEYMTMN